MSLRTEQIIAKALELGFDTAGVAPAEPAEHLPFYIDWLANGYHGEQIYLSRPDRLIRRQNLGLILPGVRSLLVVGLHYWPGPPPAEASDPARGRLAFYAQGPDYHHLMLPLLNQLLRFIQENSAESVQGRAYVDTGPLLERDHAQRARLGFFGKNCNLIQPRRGSWLFLGVLLLDIRLHPESSEHLTQTPSCGTCRRCQDACPTGAIVQPYTLDSRRCLSYFTTALHGVIPRESRPLMGNWIFGCDVCQAVCPWNRFARPSSFIRSDVARTIDQDYPRLLDLIQLSDSEFSRRFGHTPIGHIKRSRFLRNVAVAIGNWSSPEAIPLLVEALTEPTPLIRGHVAWALGQIGTKEARRSLEKALIRETESEVAEEIRCALDQCL